LHYGNNSDWQMNLLTAAEYDCLHRAAAGKRIRNIWGK